MTNPLNKYNWLKYILILVIGVFLGWIFFKDSEVAHTGHEHEQAEAGTVWTCSMHPQIRQSEPGKCPICGMDLIPLSSNSNGDAQNLFVHEMTPEAIALANIRTSEVKVVSPENHLQLSGKVQADEQKLASITANFSGRVEKLYVDFTGQEVKRGQRLATIYSPELVTAQRELLEAASTKDINPALYEAVREKLRLWKITEKQIDAIERGGEVKANFDVYAQTSGIVTDRLVSVGDYVNRGTVLFEVADLSKVWVMLDAYESDLSWIKKDSKITFTVEAIPGKEFVGTVTYVDPIISPTTRTASVRAEVANKDMILKPGMFVNAKIATKLDIQEEALAIPHTSLLWTGKRSLVYVKKQDSEMPAFELREIILGPRMDDMYLVQSGLDAGEEIVTNGVFAVDAAAQLSGNYSMMGYPESKTINVSETFRQQLTTLAEVYFNLKDALVNSNTTEAASKAKKFESTLAEVDMKLLKGEAHDLWMSQLNPLKNSAEKITKSNNIEEQRNHFQMLSNHMLETVELFGLQKDKVYKSFCPMAFDNEGAYWLSETAEIRNPYFGESMLSCGEIKETYRKGINVTKGTQESQKTEVQAHNH